MRHSRGSASDECLVNEFIAIKTFTPQGNKKLP
jgi:hypothetical protein